MRHKLAAYIHKDDLHDYGPFLETIENNPELLRQFHLFKREKEARARQDRRHLAFYVSAETVSDNLNILEQILIRERDEALSKAILKLTDTQKRRLFLRFWCELTYQEIAEIENASRVAVTKSITSALNKMQKELSN